MKNIAIAAVVLLGIAVLIFGYQFLSNTAAGRVEEFTTYENERFGFEVDVPAAFEAEEAPANDDGRVFTEPGGEGEIRVFGSNNVGSLSLEEAADIEREQFSEVNDIDEEENSIVLSGLDGDEEEKHRTTKIIVSGETIYTLEITYTDASVLASDDDARMRIVNSFDAIGVSSDDEDDDTEDGDDTEGGQDETGDEVGGGGTDTGDTDTDTDDTDEDEWQAVCAPESACELINVEEPDVREFISSPLTITGEARGYWFFEASAPVVLTDWDGRIIAEGIIEAEEPWTTEEFVPFSGVIPFELSESTIATGIDRGFLIIEKANPSGLPENEAAIEIPVRFEM